VPKSFQTTIYYLLGGAHMKKLMFLSVAMLASSYSISAISRTEKDILARLDSIEQRLENVENRSNKTAAVQAAPSKELVEVDGVTKIHTKAQLDKILSEPGAKVFKFTTKSCQFCPAMAQPFAEAAQEYKDTVKAYEIDGNNSELQAFIRQQDLPGYPTVTSIPKQNSIAGARSKERYSEFFAATAKKARKEKC
jgi:thiol-disulfide isomerase/thioredoxin